MLRDLDRAEIAGAVRAFVAAMREMRDRLSLSAKVRDLRQRQRWFLAAVEAYCDAVEQLEVDLGNVLPGSAALRGLRTFAVAYGRSQEFVDLKAETQELIAELGRVRYTVRSKGLQITVDHFAEETDLSQEVQATFARFRENAAKNYRARFLEHADNNQVESWILTLVAELNPDLFARLAQFCQRHADFLDPTLARFDREIHFYLAYLHYIEPLKAAGVAFCLPAVSSSSKQIMARGACDLVLARKLVADGVEIVANDFELSGPERILVVTGPNQGGKTTFSRMFGQLHHLAALGLPVPARQASLFLPDRMFSHFEREEDIRNLRSKFEEELVRIHEILEQASGRSILIMNESFGSTTAADSLRVGRRVLERVIELDMLCVCVTFVDELSELGDATVSMMSIVDADDLTLTDVPSNPQTRRWTGVRGRPGATSRARLRPAQTEADPMKVLLIDPAHPFDVEATPPPNADQLIQDLELETLFGAMAAGDRFLYRVARAAILGSVAITDPAVITYRQRVLADIRRSARRD